MGLAFCILHSASQSHTSRHDKAAPDIPPLIDTHRANIPHHVRYTQTGSEDCTYVLLPCTLAAPWVTIGAWAVPSKILRRRRRRPRGPRETLSGGRGGGGTVHGSALDDDERDAAPSSAGQMPDSQCARDVGLYENRGPRWQRRPSTGWGGRVSRIRTRSREGIRRGAVAGISTLCGIEGVLDASKAWRVERYGGDKETLLGCVFSVVLFVCCEEIKSTSWSLLRGGGEIPAGLLISPALC
ncbi:hypothetical protein BJ875DRAFT_70720 [Amylocarpus encephaloides]|uniref:Uncharacterized protein n=1 Tax=Amylocarpus encephaloides TaxID=45428 RepID=A0A9P7YRU0_9HELO|nr:hypothetical protein BJ875DRAFT_70720 [Amylocarpus encephaloides]